MQIKSLIRWTGNIAFVAYIFWCSNGDTEQKITYPNVIKETKTAVKVVSSFGDNDVLGSFPEDIQYNKYDKRVYVADTRKHRIVVFDEELNYITNFGRSGKGPGEFGMPSGINFLNDGRIVIADWGNYRIQIFDKNYKFINMFSAKASLSPTQYYYPCVDKNNRIYVSFIDDNSSLFSVFDDKGNIIKHGGQLLPVSIDSTKVNRNVLIMMKCLENKPHFEIDESCNIYCSYINLPFLRILDPEFNVIREANISNLGPLVSVLIDWEKFRKKDTGYQFKSYSIDVSLDNQYFYVLFNDNPKNPPKERRKLYAFNKETLSLEREIILEQPYKDSTLLYNISDIDFSNNRNIYALDQTKDYGIILLFRK